MDPIIGGSLIGAGATLVGGGLGSLDARKQAKMQEKFAKKGIRWRVRDAKAAGLHPLYALGAQIPQYSPVSSPLGESLSQAGQDIGRAAAARLNPIQRQALSLDIQQKQADLRKTLKEGDYLDAEMHRIQADRLDRINAIINQPIPEPNVRETGSAGTVFGGQAIRDSGGVPAGFITPAAPTSFSASTRNPGIAAGTTPFMREFTLPTGQKMLLPGGMQGDPSEALESLAESPLLMWSVIKQNREHYGPGWMREFLRTNVASWLPGAWDWTQRNRRPGSAPRQSSTATRTRQDYR